MKNSNSLIEHYHVICYMYSITNNHDRVFKIKEIYFIENSSRSTYYHLSHLVYVSISYEEILSISNKAVHFFVN